MLLVTVRLVYVQRWRSDARWSGQVKRDEIKRRNKIPTIVYLLICFYVNSNCRSVQTMGHNFELDTWQEIAAVTFNSAQLVTAGYAIASLLKKLAALIGIYLSMVLKKNPNNFKCIYVIMVRIFCPISPSRLFMSVRGCGRERSL